jgi:hypothetical protein
MVDLPGQNRGCLKTILIGCLHKEIFLYWPDESKSTRALILYNLDHGRPSPHPAGCGGAGTAVRVYPPGNP